MELFRLSLFSLLLQLCLIKCQSIEDVINILEEAYEEIYDNNETLLEDIDFIQENYGEFKVAITKKKAVKFTFFHKMIPPKILKSLTSS